MLNPEDAIMLVAERAGTRVLAGFHPAPGNYEVHFPPEVDLVDGQKWKFECPVCHFDLVSADNENLCALELREGDKRRRVLFSRVCGEKATYVVDGDAISERHGEDAKTYFEFDLSLRFI
jgi:hypothetical protein